MTTPEATAEETFIPDIAAFFKGGSDLINGTASNPVTLLTMTEVPDVGTVGNFHNFAGQWQFAADRPGHGFGCGHDGG